MNHYAEPLDAVRLSIGQEILIRLRNGTRITATLVGYDEHVNLMLKDVKMHRRTIENPRFATNIPSLVGNGPMGVVE